MLSLINIIITLFTTVLWLTRVNCCFPSIKKLFSRTPPAPPLPNIRITWQEVMNTIGYCLLTKLYHFMEDLDFFYHFNYKLYIFCWIIFLITITLILYLIIGRSDRLNKTNATTNQTHVRTRIYMAPDRDHGAPTYEGDVLRANGNHTTNFAKTPNEFDGKSDVKTWFTKLEAYLKQTPVQNWVNITVSYICVNCLF